MKAIYILLGLLFANYHTDAQKMTVTGNVTGIDNSKIAIHYYDGKVKKLDSIPIRDGHFTWSANMLIPQEIGVIFPRNYISFLIEGGNVKVEGDASASGKLKVTGSRMQDECLAYYYSINDLLTKQHELYGRLEKVSEAERFVLEAKYTDIIKEQRDSAIKYIAANPRSNFSMYLANQMIPTSEYEDLKPVYELFHKSMQQSTQGRFLAQKVTALKRSTIGQQILDFKLNNTENIPISITSFKGKYVLIDFWASWCGACRRENINLIELYNLYKNKNFTIVGLSVDKNLNDWKKAIAADKMPWTQLSDLNDSNESIADYYCIRLYPSTLLIDPQGKIIAKNLRGPDLTKKLAEIFK